MISDLSSSGNLVAEVDRFLADRRLAGDYYRGISDFHIGG
jgi:hypothetical protein